MIDKLELRIPFKNDVCIFAPDRSSAVLPSFDKYILQDGLETRTSRSSDDGINIAESYETHSYESLASSFSGVAFCIFPKGNGGHPFPYVMLKCSPAKILQGHNVFGFDDPKLGFLEMIAVLLHSYPTLFNDLDVIESKLMQIDCTYFSRFENQSLAEHCIKALSTTSNGQIKARSSFDTSVYWNSCGRDATSSGSHIVRVAYLKLPEVLNEISDLEKITKKKNFNLTKDAQRTLDRLKALYSVKDYCIGMVRFEARIKARKLVDCGIPTNIIKFIEFSSKRNTNLIEDLWHLGFDKIFETFEGLTIVKTDDKSILESIEKNLVTVSDSGRVNRRRSDAARGFYFELKSMGYDHVKRSTRPQTFYDRLNSLIECGLSKSFIQSIENHASNVTPLIREISINFGNQAPDNYVAPQLRMASGLDVFTGSFINNQLPKTNLRLI
jgi:II/X family phage/plasmid replication protein